MIQIDLTLVGLAVTILGALGGYLHLQRKIASAAGARMEQIKQLVEKNVRLEAEVETLKTVHAETQVIIARIDERLDMVLKSVANFSLKLDEVIQKMAAHIGEMM